MKFWTDERIETLRASFVAGSLFSVIAREIGCSKGAAIGKAHRMGFKSLRSPASASRGYRKLCAPAPRKPQVPRSDGVDLLRHPKESSMPLFPSPDPDEPYNGGVSFWELSHGQCKWPFGNPRDLDTFRYCSAPAELERPYCACHRAKASDGLRRPSRSNTKTPYPALRYCRQSGKRLTSG